MTDALGLTPGPAEGLWRTHPAPRTAPRTAQGKYSSVLGGRCATRCPLCVPSPPASQTLSVGRIKYVTIGDFYLPLHRTRLS